MSRVCFSGFFRLGSRKMPPCMRTFRSICLSVWLAGGPAGWLSMSNYWCAYACMSVYKQIHVCVSGTRVNTHLQLGHFMHIQTASVVECSVYSFSCTSCGSTMLEKNTASGSGIVEHMTDFACAQLRVRSCSHGFTVQIFMDTPGFGLGA